MLGVAGGLDLTALASHLRALPDYARPVFLRVRRRIETTATFKHVKHDLANEGFDPGRVADPLYVFDRAQDAYVVLDSKRFTRIINGAMRL
jgi:fatty-acyl-CoA synthase